MQRKKNKSPHTHTHPTYRGYKLPAKRLLSMMSLGEMGCTDWGHKHDGVTWKKTLIKHTKISTTNGLEILRKITEKKNT